MTQPLDHLSVVISEIHSSFSIRHILDTSLKWAADLLSSETAAIFLPQPHSAALKGYLRKPHDKNPRLISFKLHPPQEIEAWILATGKSTLANNSQAKTLFFKNTALPQLGVIRNFIAVPLKTKTKSVGVLQVMNRRDHKVFTPKQLKFLEMLAQHTSTALTNARAYAAQHSFMSEQKKQLLATTEQLRGANLKLREVDMHKSESISMVAHELRSPITSIAGFAKILYRGKSGPLTREQNEFCGIILKNAEHINCLISDLLDITKLELGKLEMHFEAVSCRELLKEAVFSIQGSTPPAKQRIHIEFPPENIYVQGDRLRLVQVLINLLSNALKYSPKDSPVFSHYQFDKHHVVFSVEDRGTALTAEQQKKVFEKFFRIKKNKPTSGSTQITGSGLGLAICKITIQNHGGDIWAETVPQGGNNFRIRLNRISGPAAPPL